MFHNSSLALRHHPRQRRHLIRATVGLAESTKFVSVVPPTAVVKLLQHSGIGSNTGMSFLRTNDLSEIKTGELNLDFGVWLKIGKWFEN